MVDVRPLKLEGQQAAGFDRHGANQDIAALFKSGNTEANMHIYHERSTAATPIFTPDNYNYPGFEF